MSKVYRFWFNKLVRDKAVEIMQSEGIISEAKLLDQQEYISALKDKIIEEAKEVFESNEKGLLDELADVMEVIYCLAEAHNLTIHDVENARLVKAEKRGSFKSKTYISSVSTTLEQGRLIDYMKSKPKEYVMEELD